MSNTSLIPEGTTKLIQTPEGIRFEKIEQPEATGHAYVATERATTKRDQEIEAGRKRVAEAAALAASEKNYPSQIRSGNRLPRIRRPPSPLCAANANEAQDVPEIASSRDEFQGRRGKRILR